MANQRPLVWINNRLGQLASGDTISYTLISGLGSAATQDISSFEPAFTASDSARFRRGDDTWANELINGSGALQFSLTAYGGSAGYAGGRINGTTGAPTKTLAGNQLTSLAGFGHDSSAQTNNRARMRILATADWATTSTPTEMLFDTTAVGSTAVTTRWTIQDDGFLVPNGAMEIGTSSARVATIYVTTLGMNGNIMVGTNIWRIQADTADGADTRSLLFASGGDVAATRGAYLRLNGNEAASNPGRIELISGNGAEILLSGGTVRPNATAIYDLGSTSMRWAAGYMTSLDLTGGIVAGSLRGLGAAHDFDIYQPTVDAADSGRLRLFSGGAVSTTRGAYLLMHGNEYATDPGQVLLTSGAGADLRLVASGSGNLLMTTGANWTATVVAAKFELSGSTVPAQTAASLVTIARSTSAGAGCRLALIGGNAGSTGVNFGDTDDEDVGAILYDHATETFSWRVNAASAMSLTATALTLPATPAAGTNSTVAATTAYAMSAAPNSSYRNVVERDSSHTAAKAAGTYALAPGNPAAVSGTGTLYPQGVFYYDPADHPTVNGLAPKLRIRAQVYCNDVAPTGTYIVGLYPVTRPATSGAAGLCTYTLGTVVSGSQTTTVNAPAADSSTSVVGSDFAAPSAGHYVLGFIQTGTVAASAHMHISAQLQMRNN